MAKLGELIFNSKRISITVTYAPTSKIMADLPELEIEITQGVSGLEGLL